MNDNIILEVGSEWNGKRIDVFVAQNTDYSRNSVQLLLEDNKIHFDEITFDTNVDAIKNCFYLKTGDEIMDAAVIACNPNGSAYIHYFSEEQFLPLPLSGK